MSYKHISIIIWLSVYITLIAVAQEPSMVNFSIKDGLPSNEIHGMSIGPNGQLWVATDNGICSYDGYGFEVYTTDDNLAELRNYEIFKDEIGRLWFISHSGRLTILENSVFRPYEYNDSIIKYKGNSSFPHIDFHCDSSSNVDISFHNTGRIHISGDGTTSLHYEEMLDRSVQIQSIEELDKNYLFFSDARTFGRAYSNPVIKKTFFSLIDTSLVLESPIKSGISYDFFNYDYLEDVRMISFYDNLIVQNNLGIKFLKCKGHIKTFEIINGHVWIGYHEKGLEVYAINDLYLGNSKFEFLPNNTVTDITTDKDGGIWISTVQTGLYYIPNENCINLIPGSGAITALDNQNNKLLIGLESGEIVETENMKIIRTFNTTLYPDAHIQKISFWNDDIVVLKRYSPIVLTNDEDIIITCKFNDSNDKKCTVRGFYINDSQELILSGINIFKLKKDFSVNYLFGEDSSLLYFNCMIETGENEYIIGSDIGLHTLSDGEMNFVSTDNKILNSRITHLLQYDSSHLIFASHSYGLYLYNKVNQHLTRICIEKNRCSMIVSDLVMDKDKSVWFTTNKGLLALTLKDVVLGKYELQRYTSMDGLSSNQTTVVRIFGDTLYVGTSIGLNMLTIKGLQHDVPPTLFLNHFYADSTEFVTNGVVEIPYSQNDIRISYKGIDLKSEGHILYEYQLIGQNKAPLFTTDQSVHYVSLSPGEYTFIINAFNNKGRKSSSPLIVSFKIVPPYWQTKWFITIMSVLIILIVTSLILITLRTKINIEKRKIEIQNRISDLEIAVYRAQMNPHLLFNILNAIRTYVAQGQMEESEIYIMKFSKLLRTVTQETVYSTITLEKELSTLSDYLELERMRFTNSFIYKIKIHPDIKTEDINVPSFILQPFVENSIQHGMVHKVQGGRIFINIDKEDQLLLITITDNGIGREAAMAKKRNFIEDYKSLGLSNVQKRLELINRKYGDNIVVLVIDDLFDKNMNPSGTQIRLKIVV